MGTVTTATTKAYWSGEAFFESAGWREAPLSGEYAGESIPELSARYGIDLEDSDMADEFEEGYYDALAETKQGMAILDRLYYYNDDMDDDDHSLYSEDED